MSERKDGYELAKLILLTKEAIKSSKIFKSKKIEATKLNDMKEKINVVKKIIADIVASAYPISAEEYVEILESDDIEVVIVKHFCEDLIYFH